jgi:hypothetical protein
MLSLQNPHRLSVSIEPIHQEDELSPQMAMKHPKSKSATSFQRTLWS